MLIFRNKRTKKIYAGRDWRYYKPRKLYADKVPPLLFLDDRIKREREWRNLPEDKFEAVPVALVDLRTGDKIKYQKEDTTQ